MDTLADSLFQLPPSCSAWACQGKVSGHGNPYSEGWNDPLMTTSPATLPRLNAAYLESNPTLAGGTSGHSLREKVLQFGEGGFLRGFVDWMIDGMNKKGLFAGSVVVIQPIAQGAVASLNEQNGVYTHMMRGVEGGMVVERKEVITCISRGINPYTDFEQYLKCAHNPDLRFIVSNTTEAGIAYCAEDKITDAPPSSFPSKLTLLLLERFKAFGGDPAKGFILLPCELIDNNGDNLKKTVLQTARNWNLDAKFVAWVEQANVFTNTLVDRINTGYPGDEAEALQQACGYRDELFNTSEVFHLWVIEGPAFLENELPLRRAGFNVVFAESVKPYRDRKVRILNGAHTSTVLAAYLAGKDFVVKCMQDPVVSGFMKKAIHDEIIPTLTLPRQELEAFAEAVIERFSNPFIKHPLLSISLNSVSKFKARILPSVEQYVAGQGRVPDHLAFSLAALIAFYRGTEIKDAALIGWRNGKEYHIKDDLSILGAFAKLWQRFDGSAAGIAELVDGVLSKQEWWGKDLRTIPGLEAAVTRDLGFILDKGMRAALEQVTTPERRR
ncbi:MAG: tagaturonate reductase [Candidatus Korobacteraceae bacterium]|jgi:tagaturonate reductase